MTTKHSSAEGSIRAHSDEPGVDVDVAFKAKRRLVSAYMLILTSLYVRHCARLCCSPPNILGFSNRKTPHVLSTRAVIASSSASSLGVASNGGGVVQDGDSAGSFSAAIGALEASGPTGNTGCKVTSSMIQVLLLLLLPPLMVMTIDMMMPVALSYHKHISGQHFFPCNYAGV